MESNHARIWILERSTLSSLIHFLIGFLGPLCQLLTTMLLLIRTTEWNRTTHLWNISDATNSRQIRRLQGFPEHLIIWRSAGIRTPHGEAHLICSGYPLPSTISRVTAKHLRMLREVKESNFLRVSGYNDIIRWMVITSNSLIRLSIT